MRDRGFRLDAVAEVENQPAPRVIRQHVVDGAVERVVVDRTGLQGSYNIDIDWAAEPSLIRERVQSRVAVQGNLDPLALIAGGAALDSAVDDVLANYAKGRLIFNLGHGIQPETPIAHVEQMVQRVRSYRG